MSQTSHPSTRRTAAPTDAARLRLVVLAAAFVSFLLSVFLFFVIGNETQGIFVGLWVPSILGLGAVLLAGGDRR